MMAPAFPQNQRGIVLLIFVIIVVLASFGYLVAGLSTQKIDVERQQKTIRALAQAKAALLDYAMNYPETVQGLANPDQGPGNFPCPDEDFDGDSETNDYVVSPQCNSAGNGVLARIPWQELGLEEIRDGNNELLWYAVSNNFANFAGRDVNTSTTGQITVRQTDGVTLIHNGAAQDGAVAVIIAPGEALVRDDGQVQRRSTPAQQRDPVNYLDIAYFGQPDEEDNSDYVNASANNGFITGVIRNAAGDIVVNDMIETISWEELAEVMHPRVASDIGDAIAAYADPANCGQWPLAMSFDASLPVNEYGDDVPPGEDPVSLQGSFRVDHVSWTAGNCGANLLPQWFEAENWHRNTWYATDGIASCTPAIDDCLSIEAGAAGTFTRQFVLVFSGRHGLAVNTANPSDYFEGENDNSVLDDIFNVNDPAPGADDYVWGRSP